MAIGRYTILLALVLSCACDGRPPDPNRLVVNTTEDRMAGTPDLASPDDLPSGILSLREAITIANNRPDGQLIVFDARVFPSEAPAVITLLSPLPALTDPHTHLNGEDRVVLDGRALSAPVLVAMGDITRISRLTIADAGGDAIELRGAFSPRVERVTILRPAGHAVVAMDCTEPQVRGSHFEQPGGSFVVIQRSPSAWVEESVFLRGSADAGVLIEGAEESVVAQNFIGPGDGPLVVVDSSVEVAYNVLEGGGAGVIISGPSRGSTVFRNVVIGSAVGISTAPAATETTIVHNTIYECPTPFDDAASDTFNANNLLYGVSGDFVDVAAYDFTLVPTSPHVDAGEDIGWDALGGDDERRFLGAGFDLGAVESH